MVFLLGGFHIGGAEGGKNPSGQRSIGDRRVALHPSVAKHDHAMGVARDIFLVGHQQDRQAPLLVEALEDLHNLNAGSLIEISGRLVGEQNRWIVDQGPRDRHALLLTARKLRRMMSFPPC